MIRLASVIETFEDELLAQYGHALLPSHRKALAALKSCRSSLGPRMLAQCTGCDHSDLVPHSCGHRSCPHCQHHESQQWIERQLQKRVPGEYFLLTFTLPRQLRDIAWRHQRTLYALMMRCSWETLKQFAHNDAQLQGTPGAISVLHTHSRRLAYHPHVHVIMPACAVDERKHWRTKRAKTKGKATYLFNAHALAKVFRAKMLAAMREEGLALPERYPPQWVVDCKRVGSGDKALVYLGRYLYRGVIAEKDILACADGKVTFRYRDSRTKRYKTETLSGVRFLWRVLQHVLPKGFRRTRNFGFLHPNSKSLIRLIHLLLGVAPCELPHKPRPALICRCCGAVMKIVRTRIPPPGSGLRAFLSV